MSGRIVVEFDAETGKLIAGTAKVKAEIASVGRVAKEQRTGFTKYAEEQSRALKNMALGYVGVEFAIEGVRGAFEKYKAIQIGSEKTGLSPQFLQNLSNAAEVTETDLNAVTMAAGKLSKAVVFGKEADLSTIALRAMGYSLEDLKKLSPDELFDRVGNSIAAIKDPTQRSAAAIAIFGKSGKDLIPVFEELKAHSGDIPSLSDEDVKNIDLAGKAWTRWGQAIEAAIGKTIAAWVKNPLKQGFDMTGPGRLYELFGGDSSKLFPDKKTDNPEEGGGSAADFAAMVKNQQDVDLQDKISAIKDKTNEADLSAQQKINQLIKERQRLEEKIGEASTDEGKNALRLNVAQKQAEIDTALRQQRMTLPQDQASDDFSSNSSNYNNGRIILPGVLRGIQRRKGLADARETRRRDRGLGGTVSFANSSALDPAEHLADTLMGNRVLGNGGAGSGGRFSSLSASNLADQAGFWKNPTIKPGTTGKLQDPSLMGDGSKDGATGSQDAKTDPMATLAADVAAIKKDVADRLPKKTTGKT